MTKRKMSFSVLSENGRTVNDMDIKQKKLELLGMLVELEEDIKVLRKNVVKATEDLPKVETVEDAKKFDEEHDLEEGLKYIRLF